MKKIMFLGILALLCSCQAKEAPETQPQGIANETQAQPTLQNDAAGMELLDSLRDPNDGSLWMLLLKTEIDKEKSKPEFTVTKTTLTMVNRQKGFSVVIPTPSVRNSDLDSDLDNGEPIVDARFSPTFENGKPQYVYCVVPLYVTDFHIFRYDVKTGRHFTVHHGVINSVMSSGNLNITYTGFRETESGELLPGRGNFDATVSPTGKVLWVSDFY